MATCSRAVLSGEINFGQEYVQPIGGGLRLMLEPLPSGWLLRVLPATGPRGQHDYAELATPPYQSVTPLLISTDYSFRAQDAVGWNPRRFRFAASAEEFRRLNDVYARYLQNPTASAQSEIADLVGRAAEGEFDILDSRLIAGQADQAATATGVAGHFTSTAHTLEQPDGKEAPQLGRIQWVRFRIRLDLPPGFTSGPGLLIEKYPCVVPPHPTFASFHASHH